MININVEFGQFCEVVDENSFHLETDECILLISVDKYTINNTKFTNSIDAVNYVNND